jgi:hypothetical protein
LRTRFRKPLLYPLSYGGGRPGRDAGSLAAERSIEGSRLGQEPPITASVMSFALPNFVVGPLVPAVLAGYRIAETHGWALGAVGAYAVLALTQVVALGWIALWRR